MAGQSRWRAKTSPACPPKSGSSADWCGRTRSAHCSSTTPRGDNVAIAIAEREGFAWRLLRFGKEWRRCRNEAQQRLDEVEIGVIAERSVSQLPYGEQRLLEIAIALALRPRVLLLDEPAAGVPSYETEIIHQALDRLPADIAILIIEHDMDVVFRFAHEIVVMVQGRVQMRGTPEAVSADPGVRAVYLGKTAR
jgi:branched-chain amino acid transport system ATP-binding protein